MVLELDLMSFSFGRLARSEVRKDVWDEHHVMVTGYGKNPGVVSALFFVPPIQLHFFCEFQHFDVAASKSKKVKQIIIK